MPDLNGYLRISVRLSIWISSDIRLSEKIICIPKHQSRYPDIRADIRADIRIGLKRIPPLSPTYPTRAEREARLRKWAIDHSEDPDKFVTITDKDRTDSIDYLTRIEVDANTCLFNKEQGNDPHDFMEMTYRERLIGEEILRRGLEDAGEPIWLDTDEEWGVIIPQPCKGCGRGTKSSLQLCVPCGQSRERAYNYYKQKCERETLLTPNGNTPKSAQPINQERDRPEWVNIPQTNAQWLQQMEFLSDLSYPAMIPPIDIMENRPDIYRKWSIITPNGNTPKSAQPINQERDRPEWVNIPQTNAQWLQQMEFLSDLSYPAMIPPIDIMENRPDIYRKWSISIETYRNLFQAM
ncbi:hypothetical protein Glove_426g29 [Diversispora epigaea]|uniref:Uncharacterized protein n=1 Tax=Diversispora epigaea TaxID=1348612 RepID=A0A397GW71_9GLOM|nr:hypothetical protein Glove_426g29 [Diversispora epigaea]